MPTPRIASEELRPARILLEIGLIVVSVLLALGASQWRDARGDRQMVARVLETVQSEILANRQELTRAIALREEQLASLDEGQRDISLKAARLRTTAWETLQSTGSARLLDFDLAWSLSEIHQLQQKYLQTSSAATDVMYFAQVLGSGIIEDWEEAARSFTFVIQDMREDEYELLDRYAQLAELLDE